MKPIGESGEVMGAYAQIDYCYLMLKKLSEGKLSKPRVGVVAMVDKATGYDIHLQREECKTAISLLKCIVKNKKFIEAPFENDQKALDAAKKLLKSLPDTTIKTKK